MREKVFALILMTLLVPVCGANGNATIEMTADFSAPCGTVKPLHGVNNSPYVKGGKAIDSYKKAGIPYVRLHDTMGRYGGSYFVDVPNIFRDFDADPDDPAAYDFTFTDLYIKSLITSGCKILYRLGASIETSGDIKAYRIHPPKDNLKWAKICEHIIRHYNEGWADGHHYNIEYWEIWGEPEGAGLWTGTQAQYFELYRVAANHLKKSFPHLKIGGYSSCGFYSLTRKNTPEFFKGFVTYFDDFMKYISAEETSAPLDFFSWHLYTSSPGEIIQHCRYVREKLDSYGFKHTESIFDEWNCKPAVQVYTDGITVDIKEAPGAAGTAAALCLMQYAPVDKAMYYNANPTSAFCGLYYFPTQKTTPNYFSFLAFNVLYRLGTACKVVPFDDTRVLCAAKNEKDAAILVSNFNAAPCDVKLNIKGHDFNRAQTFLIDMNHRFEEIRGIFSGGVLKMTPYSVVLLTSGNIAGGLIVQEHKFNIHENGIRERGKK